MKGNNGDDVIREWVNWEMKSSPCVSCKLFGADNGSGNCIKGVSC